MILVVQMKKKRNKNAVNITGKLSIHCVGCVDKCLQPQKAAKAKVVRHLTPGALLAEIQRDSNSLSVKILAGNSNRAQVFFTCNYLQNYFKFNLLF